VGVLSCRRGAFSSRNDRQLSIWQSTLVSSHGARTHTSCSLSIVSITGIAFGWIGLTVAFGAVKKS
jgi:hypothetical protein